MSPVQAIQEAAEIHHEAAMETFVNGCVINVPDEGMAESFRELLRVAFTAGAVSEFLNPTPK